MKIGIVSMQRVINNGSLLQAFALRKVIERMGHSVQFADFKISDGDKEILPFREKFLINLPVFYTFLSGVEKLFRFGLDGHKLAISNHKVRNNFLNKYLVSLELDSNFNYSPNVDVLVFGSDEVFNTTQYLEGRYGFWGHAWQLYGADNNAKKLVSYAASFGHTTYEGLKKYNMLEKSSDLLGQFSDFSVRDKNSYEIIKRLTGKEASINIDPVLLYDFEDIEIKKPQTENYILVYGYPGRINSKDEVTAIKTFAKKYNKKLICVNMMQTWCDEMIYAHPFDLLGYFKYADHVVTDTFHGAVISIKYNRPFVQFIRNTNNYSNNQKVGYLLHSFGLNERLLANLQFFESTMMKEIDYKSVNEKLQEEKKKSMEYLERVLRLE